MSKSIRIIVLVSVLTGVVLMLVIAGMLANRESAVDSLGPVADAMSSQAVEIPTAEKVSPLKCKYNYLIPSTTSSTSPASENHEADPVRIIVGLKEDYPSRLDALHQLARKISPDDIALLMDFLASPAPLGKSISALELNSIKNDLMEILLMQEQLPEGIGKLLIGIYGNHEHDEIWRNYSIQFMPKFYERKIESHSSKSEGATKEAIQAKELQQVQDTLWEALGERENSNAGTALLGLEKLSRNHAEFNRMEVEAAMIDLAKDEQASVANRITALRLCGETGNPQALETTRELAQNGDSTMLRCAAIATLGEIGSIEDAALLEEYAGSDDPRIQRISTQSLEKITTR